MEVTEEDEAAIDPGAIALNVGRMDISSGTATRQPNNGMECGNNQEAALEEEAVLSAPPPMDKEGARPEEEGRALGKL